MGQGLYDLLGYGTFEEPQLDHDGEYVPDYDILTALGLHMGYETEPRYLVYPLGIDEPFLQDYWHVPPLPEWAPRIAPRRARVIQPPPGYIVPSAAVQVWQQAQELYHAHGLTLANAQLIILSDWH